MKNKDKLLTIGILLSLLIFNIIAFNSSEKIKEFNLQDISIPSNFGQVHGVNETGLNATNSLNNGTGCCTVIVHLNHGHDIVSYRRDSNYSADIIINKVNFDGQNAIMQYKLQNGYFCHVIITENGWIISIGGKDGSSTNKQLEKLGSDIVSRGSIKNKDLDEANLIIKQNGWGHFVIKSPDDNVGITAYDSRTSSPMTEPSSMVKLFKMNEGNYVKVPNNPKYYSYGQFNNFSSDPIDAAIKIIGTDPYNDHGNVRRDVLTYDYTNGNNSKKADVWASFDGGTLLKGANGTPDNINFFGNEIQANELPKIPDKKLLGEEILQNNNSPKSSINLEIVIICTLLGIRFLIFKLVKKRIFK